MSSSHDLVVAKVVAMVVLFCITTICGAIPFLLNRCFKWTDSNTNARSTTAVTLLLYFGGGVLLATTFLHLLVDVSGTVEHLQACGEIAELNFGLAELLMCLGFLLMYLIEMLLHSCLAHRHKQVLSEDNGAGAAFVRGQSLRRSALLKPDADCSATMDSCKVTGVAAISDNGVVCDVEEETTRPAHPHSHLPVDNGDDPLIKSSFRGLLIVGALSLHEIFEGMSIGLSSTPASVWYMFGAISAHKLVLAFCVGVELIVANTRPVLSVVYIVTFSIVSPIGIGIGIGISHDAGATADSLPAAILQGLACGTLLYVVFFEVLSQKHAGYWAFVTLVIGFGLMFGLQNLSHDDDDSTCGTPPTDTSTTISSTQSTLTTLVATSKPLVNTTTSALVSTLNSLAKTVMNRAVA